MATHVGGEASCGDVDPVVASKTAVTEGTLSGVETIRQWLGADVVLLPANQQRAGISQIDSIRAAQSAMISYGAKNRRPAAVALPKPIAGETLRGAVLRGSSSAFVSGAAEVDKSSGEAAVSYACSLYVT